MVTFGKNRTTDARLKNASRLPQKVFLFPIVKITMAILHKGDEQKAHPKKRNQREAKVADLQSVRSQN
jgi:hypothetical protein